MTQLMLKSSPPSVLLYFASFQKVVSTFESEYIALDSLSTDADCGLKVFFLSTSRERNLAYLRTYHSRGAVLTLDSTKINAANSECWFFSRESENDPDELALRMNDFIFSNGPKLHISYATQLDLFLDSSVHPRITEVRKIMQLSRALNIKVRFYSDSKQWILGTTETRSIASSLNFVPASDGNDQSEAAAIILGVTEILLRITSPRFESKDLRDSLTSVGKKSYDVVVRNRPTAVATLRIASETILNKGHIKDKNRLDRLLYIMHKHDISGWSQLVELFSDLFIHK